MSFFNKVLNNVEEESLREELQQRVDIIGHKIKFMEKVPVSCLDLENWSSLTLSEIITAAGGVLQEDPAQSRVVIYHEPNASLVEMMGVVPSLLSPEWPAVEFNRLYLAENDSVAGGDPEVLVTALEDIAEMLYPGYFVFGNEGKTWMSFGT